MSIASSRSETIMVTEKRGREKYVRIKVRMSKSEIAMVNRQAKKRGLPANDYVRSLIREINCEA